MAEIPDISQAQEQKTGFLVGPEWVSWRDHEKTQEIIKWIRQDLIGGAQDHWANGGFATHDDNLRGQGGVMALSRYVMAVEGIQMEAEQPKQERDDEE